MVADLQQTVDAGWRMAAAKILATLTRVVGDVGLAEDLASDALVEALQQWPDAGVPRNPGAWLTTVAKRKAIDHWRRQDRLDEKYAVLARAFLTKTATIAARITRAKKTLGDAGAPFAVPEPADYPARLSAVLSVSYLIYNEGYSASSVVELNRAIAVAMRDGPAQGLAVVDEIDGLADSYLLPSVRGELLSRLGRRGEAAGESDRAAALVTNGAEREVLLDKAVRART